MTAIAHINENISKEQAIQQAKLFATIMEKSLHAYRLRLGFVHRRHQVLERINGVHSKITEQDITELKDILRNESRLLKLIQGGEKESSNAIKTCSNIFKNTINDKSGFAKQAMNNLRNTPLKGLNLSRIQNISLHLWGFIDRNTQNLEKIEDRIEKEKRFLESRDVEAFNHFIETWDQEMKDEEEIMKDYEKIVNENREFFQFFLHNRHTLMPIFTAPSMAIAPIIAAFAVGISAGTGGTGFLIGAATWNVLNFSFILAEKARLTTASLTETKKDERIS